MNTYQPRGVCSRKILFDVEEDGTIHHVSFEGGCNGNLQGIGSLIEGMGIDEAIARLAGIQCGMKGTSCPDQLARALKKYKEEHQ
ncbi:MAG: TIGR03905 family protein [Clostridiales bacterium]|nr:MAG: TIGR03905 family protein [Clostridiales bacterium]